MKLLSLKELRTHPDVKQYFEWIQEWTEDALFDCFHFTAVELDPCEFYFSDGGACILVKGRGTVDGNKVSSLASFGIDSLGDNTGLTSSNMYRAEEESIIVSFNRNIFNNICFGMGCGSIHTKFRTMILDSHI